MNVYTTTSRVNGTSSAFSDFYNKMRKMLNVSPSVMFVICATIILAAGIIIIIIIFCIRRCLRGRNEKKNRRRDDTMKNLFGDDVEKYDSEYGYLDLNVTFDKKRKKLIIRDIQANNLKVSTDEPPDCYVKLFMKNSKGKKINIKQTKTKIDNYMPLYDEMFGFNVEVVEDAVIYFQISDQNPHGNDIMLGEGELRMSRFEMDTYVGSILPTYLMLKKPSEKDGFGEICVVLSSRLNHQRIVVLEAKDLVFKYQKVKLIGLYTYPSVYVKVIVKGKHIKKQFTTKMVKNTENPYFHESFDFHIKSADLKQTCIKIEVLETLPGKIPKRIGKVFIGNPEADKRIKVIGKLHWDLVCKELNSPKAMWHSLIH